MARPFAIVTTQRSGSTMLVQTLRRHPQVICHHELFRKAKKGEQAYYVYGRSSIRRGAARILAPPLFSMHYLHQLCRAEPEAQVVGFKIMYNQLRRRWELPWVFKRMGVRVIHLVRENVLKTHISSLIARKRRVFNANSSSEEIEKIVLPTTELLKSLSRRASAIEAHRRKLQRFPHIEVRYESLISDRQAELSRILGFLEVDVSVFPVTDFVKLLPNRLQRVIANYEEVEATLAPSRFATLLD